MQIAIEATMIHQDSGRVSFISELDDIDTLVRVYRPRILRYVAFSVGDQDLAETLTQECFLKAYNARASFRGDAAVSTWLFSIANNLVRSQVRTKKFQFWRKASATALDVSEMASFLPSRGSSPEAVMIARERTKQVAGALEKLSVNQRRVFLLRFSEELDVSEIAEATGMQINTVKTHLHRAVTAIRTELGGRA
jgi:RNA polymerase sigma-70 factor (ECF subfamily)